MKHRRNYVTVTFNLSILLGKKKDISLTKWHFICSFDSTIIVLFWINLIQLTFSSFLFYSYNSLTHNIINMQTYINRFRVKPKFQCVYTFLRALGPDKCFVIPYGTPEKVLVAGVSIYYSTIYSVLLSIFRKTFHFIYM